MAACRKQPPSPQPLVSHTHCACCIIGRVAGAAAPALRIQVGIREAQGADVRRRRACRGCGREEVQSAARPASRRLSRHPGQLAQDALSSTALRHALRPQASSRNKTHGRRRRRRRRRLPAGRALPQALGDIHTCLRPCCTRPAAAGKAPGGCTWRRASKRLQVRCAGGKEGRRERELAPALAHRRKPGRAPLPSWRHCPTRRAPPT